MLIFIIIVAVLMFWVIWEAGRVLSVEGDYRLYQRRVPRFVYALASVNAALGIGLLSLWQLDSFGSGIMLLTLALLLAVGARYLRLYVRQES